MLIKLFLSVIIFFLFFVCFVLLRKIQEKSEKNIELLSKNNFFVNENENLKQQINDLVTKNTNMLLEYEDLKEVYNELRIKNEQIKFELLNKKESIKEILMIKDELTNQFKLISNEIIKNQGTNFNTQQEKNLLNLINPLNKDIIELKEKLKETDKNNIESKVAIETQINNLMEQTKSIGEKADNLADVLKDNKKIQGNWGEMTLRNIFESIGFINGIDYFIQERKENESNNILIPDFVVNLPEEKKIIIDVKVSINNYKEYVNSKTDIEKDKYMKDYCRDIKNHINELSNKEYQKLYNQSPDFVFMYLPLESAYFAAIKYDEKLMKNAIEKKINIVTASTIVPILETIKSFKNIEKQNKNVEKIIYLANRLCEKFEKYRKNMENVKSSLDNAISFYYDAYNYIIEGKGNIKKTVEEIGSYIGKNIETENISG